MGLALAMKMRSSLICVGILYLAIFLVDSQGQAPIDEAHAVEAHVHPIEDFAEIVPETTEEEVLPEDEILLETQIEATVSKAKKPFNDTALGKVTDETVKPNHSPAAEAARLKKAFGSAPIPEMLKPLLKPKAFGSAGPKPLIPWRSIHMPYPQFPPPLIPRYISGETDDKEDEGPIGKNSLGCNKLTGCNPTAEAICEDTSKDCSYVVHTGQCVHPRAMKECMKSCNQCPQGVPPSTWEQSEVGPKGHLYLGGGRRRVGAGFGRRRAHKIPKAVKKLLTKKQIRKIHPKPDPKTLIYSKHAILRAAAPGNDGIPKNHVKPKNPPKKKAMGSAPAKVMPSLSPKAAGSGKK